MKNQSDIVASGQTFSRLSHRRGTVMVYLAVILPIMFGVLALVLDFGLGAVTQRTMQTAADNAAVEGLLIRDQGMAELDQRQHVRQTIQQQFDDDMLDPGDVDGDSQFGAGMILPVTAPGRTNLNGSETLGYGSILPYDPDPQLNLGNLEHGDMVRGYYRAGERHDEGYKANAYERDDFVTLNDIQPLNSTDAFLVRLRRTPDQPGGLDNVDDVSSSGGSVAALFARGTLAKATDPGTASIRRDGLSVRATSIASAEKTVVVGPMIPAALTGPGVGDIEGYYPFTLSTLEWANIPLNAGLYYEVTATGAIVQMGGTERVGQVIRIAFHSESLEDPNPNAVGALDSTISVYSNQGLGTDAVTLPFLIRIDDEIMRVVDRTGPDQTDWVVERGVNGSTASNHSNTSLIYVHEPATVGDFGSGVVPPVEVVEDDPPGNSGGNPNHGHGNNDDGVDSSNPGQGGGGPTGDNNSGNDPSDGDDDETRGPGSDGGGNDDGDDDTPLGPTHDISPLFAEGSRLYLPLYYPGMPDILVGYGVANVLHAPTTDNPNRIQIIKLPQIIAPRNASANFGSGFNRLGGELTTEQINELFAARRAFNDEPLRSPASVSSMSR